MKYLSICSGIEAASVAFGPLGWAPVGFSEIDPFPSAVLAERYPDVTNFGDMTNFAEWPEQLFLDADLIVGGPPCQAFSVAGLRGGLTDARGNLTLVYVQLINHADRVRSQHGKPPVIIIFENVAGILSDRTNAFGALLAGLAGEDEPLVPAGKKWTDAGGVLGPQRTVAWRCLDAQHFGLAQRRKRLFLVAGAGTFDPAEVLFEFGGVRRDAAPHRGPAAGDAGPVDGRPPAGGEGRPLDLTAPRRVWPLQEIGKRTGASTTDVRCGIGIADEGSAMYTLQAGAQHGVAATQPNEVRRLTPREAERLQGFPDDWTRVAFRGKPAEACADTLRHKVLGNSMAVPVMSFLGRRIAAHLGA